MLWLKRVAVCAVAAPLGLLLCCVKRVRSGWRKYPSPIASSSLWGSLGLVLWRFVGSPLPFASQGNQQETNPVKTPITISIEPAGFWRPKKKVLKVVVLVF